MRILNSQEVHFQPADMRSRIAKTERGRTITFINQYSIEIPLYSAIAYPSNENEVVTIDA